MSANPHHIVGVNGIDCDRCEAVIAREDATWHYETEEHLCPTCEEANQREMGFPCKKCGAFIARSVRDGQDVHCYECGQLHNCFGQQIDYPYGRGEDYAGERWDDDY